MNVQSHTFLLFKLVCDQNGIDCNSIIDKQLEQSCKFIHTLMDKNGNIPNIGDQDSAVLVNFGLNNHENFQSILNTGAVLFERPEFCRKNFPDFKTCILLGERVKGTDAGAQGSGKSRLLKESGLTVIRGNIHGKKFVFTGNATPLGMPPLYAHGHLDALSFTLSVDGQKILVDPGTYLYHSGGRWRRYFRSTAAHNTVRINKTDMSEQIADFMFGKPFHITEHSFTGNDLQAVWRAGHDAYMSIETPVSHVRQAIFKKNAGVFEITDFLKSDGNYIAEQFFHFHPECMVKFEGKTAIITRDSLIFKILFDSKVEIIVCQGCEEPLLGWYSRSFNHMEKCITLICRIACNGNVELMTNIECNA